MLRTAPLGLRPEPPIYVAVSAIRRVSAFARGREVTSKVTVEAQSQPCEIRLMPRVGDNDLWKTLSAETRRFAQFTLPAGERREFHVHSGQSVMVREWSDTPATLETNNYDELRATPETSPPGRYLLRGDGFWDKPYEAALIEWSEGGRLRLGRPGTDRWLEGRDIPFVVECLASADTHPKDGDVQQAPLVSGAVGEAETPNG